MTIAEYLTGCCVSLLVHESGHLAAAYALGVRVKKVGISLRGPYIVRETGAPISNSIISAAGPFANLLLAAICFQFWPTVALINLVLGIANLFPTKTSDGRRAIDALKLARRSQDESAPFASTAQLL